MEEMKVVRCRCGVDIIFSRHRAPICGNCGVTVYPPRPPRVSVLTRLLDALFAPPHPDRPPLAKRMKSAPVIANDLKRKIDSLALKSWGSADQIHDTLLVLPPDKLLNLEHTEILRRMLRHVDRVAPSLDVPCMVPRLINNPRCLNPGEFIEEDGWVRIGIGPGFFHDLRSAKAILCHELCHYVLFANGIREMPTHNNERLTDVAMFVFGLGDIYLAGYRKKGFPYRQGHKLGYLEDQEYIQVYKYVHWLRASPEFLAKARRRPDNWKWDRELR
jgi:hypothetical protein